MKEKKDNKEPPKKGYYPSKRLSNPKSTNLIDSGGNMNPEETTEQEVIAKITPSHPPTPVV